MKTCTIVANINETQPTKDYEEMAIRLAKSVRLNGGEAKNIPICFWWSTDYLVPSNRSLEILKKDYGCELRSGPARLMKVAASYGKIYAFQEKFDTDYVLHIDNDSYVLSDFSGLYSNLDKDVRLCPSMSPRERWNTPADDQQMEKYYAHFGLKRNITPIPTMAEKGISKFYFYSTMLVFKTGIQFGHKYEEIIEGTRIVDGGETYNNNGMISLGILVTKFNLSWALIDPHYMYNYAHHDHKMDGSKPAIVHYQNCKVPGVSEEDWNVFRRVF